MKTLSVVVASALAVALAQGATGAPEILNLGVPPGASFANGYALSADATRAVVQAGLRSFVWIEGEGYTEVLPLPGQSFAIANAMSADGQVVVGTSGSRAFRWTAPGGAIELASLMPGGPANAYGVNTDGTVVVGGTGSRAIRWVNGVIEELPNTFPSQTFAEARAVSADGAAVAGFGSVAASSTRALRWTGSPATPENLGVLTGANFSRAEAISADGSTVTGYSQSPGGPRMFRWTATDGLVNLGTVNNLTGSSFGYGVNADGTMIVGESAQVGGALWTPDTGLVSLADFLVMKGADISAYAALSTIRAVTPDGDALVATALTAGDLQTVAIVVRGLNASKPCDGDTNGDGVVNFADLNTVLSQFGQTGQGLAGDVNNDGVVNFADLNGTLTNFGSTCQK